MLLLPLYILLLYIITFISCMFLKILPAPMQPFLTFYKFFQGAQRRQRRVLDTSSTYVRGEENLQVSQKYVGKLFKLTE